MAILKNQHLFTGVHAGILFGKKQWVIKETSIKKKYGTEEVEGMKVSLLCVEDNMDYGLDSKGQKIESFLGGDVEVTVEDYKNLVDLKFMDKVYPNPKDVTKSSVYLPNGAKRLEVSIKMKQLSTQPLQQPASSQTATRQRV